MFDRMINNKYIGVMIMISYKTYKIVLIDHNPKLLGLTIELIIRLTGISDKKALVLTTKTPSIVVENINYSLAVQIQELFDRIDAFVDIEESIEDYCMQPYLIFKPNKAIGQIMH